MVRLNLVDRLFPVKYDFYQMLSDQARMNAAGVETLFQWLEDRPADREASLLQQVAAADEIRMNLEKNLIQAFSTPFDRGDIYSISVGMDKVIEYAKSTLLSIKAYEVETNETITSMVQHLKNGALVFSESIDLLKTKPLKAEANIVRIREAHIQIEQHYRDGMVDVFKSNDPIAAFKKREVYHHIKDASANQEEAVDLLHRIVVWLT